MIFTCKKCSYNQKIDDSTLKSSSVITVICKNCNHTENLYIKYTYKRVDSIFKSK